MRIVKASKAKGIDMVDEEELLKIIHSYQRLIDIKICYCRDFLEWYRKLTVNIEIVSYVDYVYQLVVKKQSNSFERLFIYLSMQPDVLDAYCRANKNKAKKDIIQILHINCPACGSIINKNDDCPICGLERIYRKDSAKIRFHKGWCELTEDELKEYEFEMAHITSMPISQRDERDKAEFALKKRLNLIN